MRRAILLFVKYPEPGRVKTRLAATVGADAAAQIYRRLVAAVLAGLPCAEELVVAFDPPEKRAEIVAWLGASPAGRRAVFLPQAAGDLGARLERAFAETFALGFENVAVIGSDCIEMTPATFTAAWEALATHDAVLGPSTDGGYYLLALRQPCAALFHGIAWSTGAVRAETLARAHSAGLRVQELASLPDIDTEADWRRAEEKLGVESCASPTESARHSAMTPPLVFEPLFMERVWGGRRMEHLLGKKLPHGERIGESWEIVDREEAQSVVHSGPLRGATLHELWTERRAEIFGHGLADTPRFPLLCKILDAQERLSVQVHPPAGVADRLGGEPKTEMWFILDALLDSDLYAGLRRGVTREGFQTALENGTVAEQIHSFPVKTGDAMFIPSGRIHAIGAGNLIIEVQQNSDTTYRVFDWNRRGLDGQPRELHVGASMESIDFTDLEPQATPAQRETVADCAYFRVEKWALDQPRTHAGPGFAIFSVIAGRVRCADREFTRGAFFLLPAETTAREIHPLTADAAVLRTTIPGQS